MSRDRSSATGSAGRLPPKPINNIQASRRRIDAAQMQTRAVIKAKFHYTGPTGPARTLSETRTDQRSFSETRAAKKSVRVRAGPVGPV